MQFFNRLEIIKTWYFITFQKQEIWSFHDREILKIQTFDGMVIYIKKCFSSHFLISFDVNIVKTSLKTSCFNKFQSAEIYWNFDVFSAHCKFRKYHISKKFTTWETYSRQKNMVQIFRPERYPGVIYDDNLNFLAILITKNIYLKSNFNSIKLQSLNFSKFYLSWFII